MTTATKPARKARKTYDGPSAEELLVADLVALMESSDLPPWRREWTGQQGEHRSLETGQPYRGANPILLELGSMLRGHTLPLWIGGAQAKTHGWWPRKGCKAVRIVRPKLNKRDQQDDNGQPVTGPDGTQLISAWVSFKPVAVFNAADLVGTDEEAEADLQARIREAIGQPLQLAPQARLEAAEAVLEAWPVATSWGGTRACYSPSLDQIRMPEAEAFTTREAFAAQEPYRHTHRSRYAGRLRRGRHTSCSATPLQGFRQRTCRSSACTPSCARRLPRPLRHRQPSVRAWRLHPSSSTCTAHSSASH